MPKKKLINPQTLCKILGQLVLIEALMMLVSLIVGIIYKEENHVPFIVALIITATVGIVLQLTGLKSPNTINRREAYLVVGLTWIIFSLLGTIPFLINGQCSSFGAAMFEAMSGFTATGFTVMPDVDALPHSILFWRSFMHWIGGLGIVFFTMTILPVSGSGEIRLFAAESTGLGQEKLHAKIKTTAAWIWSIYIILTTSCAISLYLGGMSLFDSVNHAMSTIATGGFSTHNNGILFYDSILLQYIMLVFMLLGGTSFFLLYTAGIRRSLTPFKNSNEFKFYLLTIFVVAAICALSLMIHSGYDFERSIRTALFNCVSISTTSGFIVDDYQQWFRPTCMLLMFLMFVGGCSGSTSGGFKSIRMLIIIKTTRIQFKRILHPNAVIPVQINKVPINSTAEHNVMALLFWFLFLIVIGAGALMLCGLPGYDSCALSLDCISNIGTNFGHVYGPSQGLVHLPESAKWICSFLMLAGRLEIFAILLPFTRSFWRRQ